MLTLAAQNNILVSGINMPVKYPWVPLYAFLLYENLLSSSLMKTKGGGTLKRVRERSFVASTVIADGVREYPHRGPIIEKIYLKTKNLKAL